MQNAYGRDEEITKEDAAQASIEEEDGVVTQTINGAQGGTIEGEAVLLDYFDPKRSTRRHKNGSKRVLPLRDALATNLGLSGEISGRVNRLS